MERPFYHAATFRSLLELWSLRYLFDRVLTKDHVYASEQYDRERE